MCTDKKCFSQVRNTARFSQVKGRAWAVGRIIVCNLLLPGIALLFLMFLTTEAGAFEQPNDESYENLDARWLPWIGSWRLVSDEVDTDESDLIDQYLLTVSPESDGKTISMTGRRDGLVLFEENIETDGVRSPLKKDDCTGWQSYAWSETGKRLLFNGESSCPGDLSQQISGMSIIDDAGDWLDIQLLQGEEEKAITIRRYRNVDAEAIAPGRTSADRARVARLSAGTGFSINEIIELSGKVQPEVLEAALVEMHKPFPINSKQLLRLVDSGVPTEIVDLMVALSFPDEFIVEKTIISRVQKPELQQSSQYFCSPYAHRFCPPPMYTPRYHYWYLDMYYWPGWYHYSWWYPNYMVGGYGVKTGRLVKGHGYTRVYSSSSGSQQPRYARPRGAPAAQATRSGSPSSVSTARSSSVSSGSSSSGSSSGSRSVTPSASPSGYSSGNGDEEEY
jgi:hypothetical protein